MKIHFASSNNSASETGISGINQPLITKMDASLCFGGSQFVLIFSTTHVHEPEFVVFSKELHSIANLRALVLGCFSISSCKTWPMTVLSLVYLRECGSNVKLIAVDQEYLGKITSESGSVEHHYNYLEQRFLR